MADQFDFYRKEITAREAKPDFVPSIDAPRLDMTVDMDRNVEVSGYWRYMASRTKVDTPIGVWLRDDGVRVIKQGAGLPYPLDGERYTTFRNWRWPHLAAVTKSEFLAAIATGKWADGRLSKEAPGVAEEFDLSKPPPATGDEAPEGANLTGDAARDAYAAEIRAKIEPLAEKARALFPLNTKEKCEKAAKLREDIRKLGEVGNTQRKAEKKPLDDAVTVVQGRWAFLKDPSDIAAAVLEGVDKWQKTEERRLAAEQEAARRAETKRIAAENAERIRIEQEEAAARAADLGDPEPDVLSEEAIAEQAQAEAEQKVAETPAAPITRPQVQATPNSKATSKARLAMPRIDDMRKLAEHFIATDDKDFIAYMMKRATAAVRAKFTLPGVSLDE